MIFLRKIVMLIALDLWMSMALPITSTIISAPIKMASMKWYLHSCPGIQPGTSYRQQQRLYYFWRTKIHPYPTQRNSAISGFSWIFQRVRVQEGGQIQKSTSRPMVSLCTSTARSQCSQTGYSYRLGKMRVLRHLVHHPAYDVLVLSVCTPNR